MHVLCDQHRTERLHELDSLVALLRQAGKDPQGGEECLVKRDSFSSVVRSRSETGDISRVATRRGNRRTCVQFGPGTLFPFLSG